MCFQGCCMRVTPCTSLVLNMGPDIALAYLQLFTNTSQDTYIQASPKALANWNSTCWRHRFEYCYPYPMTSMEPGFPNFLLHLPKLGRASYQIHYINFEVIHYKAQQQWLNLASTKRSAQIQIKYVSISFRLSCTHVATSENMPHYKERTKLVKGHQQVNLGCGFPMEMHSNSIRLLVFLLIQLLVLLLRFQTTVSFITAVRFYSVMPVLVINRFHT